MKTRADATLQLYVSAVALMSEQVAAWQHGETASMSIPHRVAHTLTTAPDKRDFALANVLATGPRDDASRGVQSAMLCIAAAEPLVRDARTLRHLALAALLVDAGRARLAGVANLDLSVFQRLPDALDALAPASSAALGLVGWNGAPTIDWAVTAFEVAWLERPHLGPLYEDELEPRFGTRLLRTVRAFLERIAPRGGAEPLSPLEALASLDGDRRARALLAAAVGRPPTGTLFELETGQWAVMCPPDERRLARVLTDEKGRALQEAVWTELGQSGGANPTRLIAPADARFNVAQAFFSDFAG
jgi:hypothetical protein